MKFHRSVFVTAAILAFAAPAFAGKKKKNNADGMTAAQVLEKFDTNHNGKIDGDEVAALRAAFAGADADKLKHFDTNGDGKLDDSEIAAIKADGKKKKKNQ